MYERIIKTLKSKTAKVLPSVIGIGVTLGEMSRDAALRNTDLWDILKETTSQYKGTVIPRGLGYVAEGIAIALAVYFSINLAKSYFEDKKELE